MSTYSIMCLVMQVKAVLLYHQTQLTPEHTSGAHWGPLCQYQALIWKWRIPLRIFLPLRHRTPDSQGRRGSCKLTGMQTDTETHGCVGKLLWRRRDKLEWTEEAKEDRKREEPVKQPRCRSVD